MERIGEIALLSAVTSCYVRREFRLGIWVRREESGRLFRR